MGLKVDLRYFPECRQSVYGELVEKFLNSMKIPTFLNDKNNFI